MSKKILKTLLTFGLVVGIVGVYLLLDYLLGGILPGGIIFVG